MSGEGDRLSFSPFKGFWKIVVASPKNVDKMSLMRLSGPAEFWGWGKV